MSPFHSKSFLSMTDQQQERPTLTLDGVTYNLDEFPDDLKVMAIDLIRVEKELIEINFKARVHSLSKEYLVTQIKKGTNDKGILGVAA